ncbi:MAG: SusC/RagA family TonB-linked outer membrane protein [Cyclobacteriaceae bacterium]
MKKYLLSLLSVCIMSLSWAQDRTITGKVTDGETGEAIPGVNVVETGTSNGVITDFDGNYRISLGDGTNLSFSFVGYMLQNIEVGARSVIDVSLVSDVEQLEEIVVVGYGTQEKKEITSSVASVKAKDFNQGMVNNPAQLIQGKVGGLTVARPGGDPNGSYQLRMRGVSTFGANAQPLVVIDGVIGGDLNTVDPSDIASMDILKDGSAAAIYGTRGSSGVILITTKTGSKGRTTVDYNGSVSFENVANSIDFMTADEFRQVDGTTDLGSETVWLDEVTRTGISNIHSLSLGGGNQSTTYRASVNMRNVEGVGLNTGFKRLNARMNINQKALNDRLTVRLDMSATTKDAQFGNNSVFDNAIIANPTMPVLFDGTQGLTDVGGYAERDIFRFWNPVSIAEQLINDGTDQTVLGSLKAEYDASDFVDGLRIGAFYSQNRRTEERGFFAPSTAKLSGQGAPNGTASRRSDFFFNQLVETTVNYDKSFGSADLAILGGYSYQEFYNEGFGLSGGNYLTNAFTYNRMQAALDFPNGLGNVFSYANSNKLIAFFGRANLNVDGTYFLSASVRREGSSRFGTDNQWGVFPAVSAGVSLDNLFTIAGVDQLKLRVGWGQTGNQPGQSYLSLRRYGPSGSFYYNGSYVPSYGPQSNPNPELKWEVKDEIDVGLDFALMDGKLTGTFDWYRRVTSDLLFNVVVPVPPNLFNRTWKNIGEMTNTGVELSLNYEVVNTGNLSYSTGVNFASFETIIEKLDNSPLYTANMGSPGQNATNLSRVADGEPLGQLFLPVKIGVYGADDPLAGSPIFEDLDGDGTYCDCNDDKQVVGNGLPDFTIGWANSFTFGAFDLNVFFRGAFGHDMLNSYRGFYENYEGTTVANYNVVKGDDLEEGLTKAVVNSSHVENASFFKLDNATLGYRLPIGENEAGFRQLRVYASIQNPFVITGYTGIDPEVRYTDLEDNTNGALAPGIERRNTYFTTSTISFGVNLGF